MSAMSDRLTASALRVLDRQGGPWLFVHTDSAGDETQNSGVGALVKIENHELGGAQVGDRVYIFNATSAPQVTDVMTNASQSYVVVRVDPTDDAPCAWWVWARAG